MTDAAVVGGGAAGLAAAIAAVRRGLRVDVYESGDRVGKKILASGNGKCNLAARKTDADSYNTPFVDAVFRRVGERDVEDFFTSLGLLMRDSDGRIYPYGESAASVLGVLRAEADRLGVRFRTGVTVESIQPIDGGYRVADTDARGVVVATGSPATFGRDSTGLARGLGLAVRPFAPALCPLLCDPDEIRGLRGVRVKGIATLYDEEREIARESGEILFKDNGLSGIAIFNLSSRIARGARATRVALDCFPDYTEKELGETLARYGWIGVCHKELARNAAVRAANDPGALARCLKHFSVAIGSLGSPALAQVMSGGVAVEELDDTCMSARFPRLYFVGETVDVDGLCGGYNLLWAWASGLVAGGAV